MANLPVLSYKNSKFNDGSISVSFSRSLADNCEAACAVRDICYSDALERRYPTLDAKLKRHEEYGFSEVCRRAYAELVALKGTHVAWVRISTHGSVPSELTTTEYQAWRRLINGAKRHRNPNGSYPEIHCPIETEDKASMWRQYCRTAINAASTYWSDWVSPLVVRASVSNERFMAGASTHASTVADAAAGPKRRKRRLRAAFSLAKKRRKETGTACAVCPSEAYRYKTGCKMSDVPHSCKCGLDENGIGCTLCARSDISGIVFIA